MSKNDYIADIEQIICQLYFRGISKVLTVCYDELDRVGTTLTPKHQGLRLVKGGAAI